MAAPQNLTPDSRQILDQIEYHATTHKIGWNDLVTMLKEVAEVEESHGGGKIVVRLDNERLEIRRPDGVPVSEATVLELRRMFKHAGWMG
ncbi:hypothetical protein N1027_11410 [Herbiconiux sp. CPCC 205763]|uniref:Uncharacterized protein n=1 Tax=Herbiconiux aconitum TaxID=2970913 RepID=A0ABT2GTV1_9MICO|nr:hypothetical protein [Herbiconiux aconitum]MCS5718740.1 hypothetical protein [Herbiconiux aconitum]